MTERSIIPKTQYLLQLLPCLKRIYSLAVYCRPQKAVVPLKPLPVTSQCCPCLAQGNNLRRDKGWWSLPCSGESQSASANKSMKRNRRPLNGDTGSERDTGNGGLAWKPAQSASHENQEQGHLYIQERNLWAPDWHPGLIHSKIYCYSETREKSDIPTKKVSGPSWMVL